MIPDRLVLEVPVNDPGQTKAMALDAVRFARRQAPKMSGASAKRISPISGSGWIGLTWLDSFLWYQEMGIRSFTMKNLQGKTIPMWIDDPSGKEQMNNPKAKTRTTASGKTQVLIFRRAAVKGSFKPGKPKAGGGFTNVASVPGSPGRIRPNHIPGTIVRGNIGIKWYFPGTAARMFLHQGLYEAASRAGVVPGDIYPIDETGMKIAA